LNAKAEKGALSSASRLPSVSSLSSFMPFIASTSVGDGKYSTTESSTACTPLFLKAEPQEQSTISLFSVRVRNADFISASDKSPSSRYLSINSSEASAASDTRFSCHSSAKSCISTGISS
jgi:hypothetical protein